MRRAVTVMSPETGGGPWTFIQDAGFADENDFPMFIGTGYLGFVESDELPEECECQYDGQPVREVSFSLHTYEYGKQRIIKVEAVRLTGRTLRDILPRGFD
jgi:hypothetical protein